MPELVFDFTWYKDPKGYRLMPPKPLRLRSGQSILDANVADTQPARIVRNGGALQHYQPLNIPDLFRKFIVVRSAEDVLRFVEKFGPLTHDGLRRSGDVVPAVIDQAESMAQVLRGRIVSMPLSKLNASIVTEDHNIRLKVGPACLLDALWLQLAQMKSGPGKAKLRFCAQCDKLLADKRADAKFCSDKCRVNYNRRSQA
jgi:hypothetical protein